MKKIFLLLILFCFSSCKTLKPVAEIRPEITQTPVSVTAVTPPDVNFSDKSTWILGYFNPNILTQPLYSGWYIKGYDDYQFSSSVINQLQDISKDNLTIKIVMGVWCSDSRREIPRFMRILDIWSFPVSMITFIGVDNAKSSSVEEYDKLNIQLVPTFIIYKNNIEAGRIIEKPTTSLEQDLVNILTRNE
jgi:thiol-disulfide isomerase/thioredoxin